MHSFGEGLDATLRCERAQSHTSWFGQGQPTSTPVPSTRRHSANQKSLASRLRCLIRSQRGRVPKLDEAVYAGL